MSIGGPGAASCGLEGLTGWVAWEAGQSSQPLDLVGDSLKPSPTFRDVITAAAHQVLAP